MPNEDKEGNASEDDYDEGAFISLVISYHRGKGKNCFFLESPSLHFIEKYFTGEIKGHGNLIIKGRHNGLRKRSVEREIWCKMQNIGGGGDT